MQTHVTQTNTTAAISVLSHADLVRVLGLAVAVDVGLRIDAPGTLVTVDLDPTKVDGEFSARVAVLIDHNFVAPEPEQGDTGAPTDPSLNSAGTQPPVPATLSVVSPPSPLALQIPGAPAPAAA